MARPVHGRREAMDRAAFADSAEARCPAVSWRTAAIGPVTLALAALGCGPASVHLVYAGTGSAQTTGEAAADLGHQEVHVKMCNGVRRSFLAEREYFAAIVVGRGCTIAAQQAGRTVVGWPGTTCTLRIDGRVHRLRVTDATATFGQQAFWTKYGLVTAVDQSVVQARIGGDESDGAGGVRHSLFVFEGPLERVTDAEDWCLATLQRPPPSTPVKPEQPETVEANGF
jgi:hypothetical protein